MKADRIVFGFFIVVVGVLWFLVNIGMIPAIKAQELWRYWPLLLVLWGLLMIFGKGSSGSGCLVFLLVMLVIFGGFSAMFFPIQRGPNLESSQTAIDNLYEATALDIEIVQHAGEFTLSSHAGSRLMSLNVSGSYPPEVSHTQSGETAEIKIRDQADSFNIDRRLSRWELTLPTDMPANVTLRVGGTKSEFDLRSLDVQQLIIKAGAGEFTLWLGQSDTEITIENGAGNITIYVPAETGVRLRTSGGLMSIQGDHARVISVGDRTYESDNLKQKEFIAEIRITAGAGAVTLKKK